MTQFLVEPEKLRQIAADIKDIEGEFLRTSGNVRTASGNLVRHSALFAQFSRTLNQIADRIETDSITARQMSSALYSIASIYIQTENRLAGNTNIPEIIRESIRKTVEAIYDLLRKWKRIPGGTSSPTSSYDGDPVDMTTGNYVDDVEELKIYSPSGLEMIRHYNSLYLQPGSLGVGWTHNYEMSLQRDGDMMIVIWGNQTQESFVRESDKLYRSASDGTEYLSIEESEILLHTKGGSKYHFDPDGRLVSITHLSGIRNLFFSYEDGRLARAEDTFGNYLEYHYTREGFLESAADHTGRKVSFEYESGLLCKALAADGLETNYHYDEKGRLAEVQGPDGIVRLFNEYDDSNRVVFQKMADGSQARFEYEGQEVSFTDRNGAKTVYVHDDMGRIKEARYPAGTEFFGYDECGRRISYIDLNGNLFTRKYDADGNITEFVDGSGNISRYTYDINGNRIQSEVPDCGSSTAGYDEQGNMVSLVDSQNTKTLFTYKNGLLIRVLYANGSDVSFEYDDKGRMIAAKDERGFTQRFSYDDLGRRVLFEDGCHVKTVYTYDEADRIKTIRNGLGQEKVYHYENGRLIRVDDFDGFSESWEYDSMGQVTRHTDKEGREVSYRYDSMGNISEICFPDGGVVTRSYDLMNRLIEVKGPEDSVLRMKYDGDGNCICRDEDGHVREFTYDAMSHVSSILENKGLRKFEYDKAGRITKVLREDGEVFEYRHDSNGRVVLARKPRGLEYHYEYDVRGNLVSADNGLADKTCYEYFPNGQISRVIYQNGNTIENDYDPEGRLISETRSDGYGLRYEYDALGRKIRTTDTEGHQRTWEYDTAGNTSRAVDSLGRSTFYRYSPNGQLIYMKDPLGNETRYKYDPMDRLTAVLQANVTDEEAVRILEHTEEYQKPENKELHLTTWTRDKNGRILSRTDSFGNTGRWEYRPDGQVRKHWDEENRCTEYQYDQMERLEKVIYPDRKTAAYSYNKMGQITGVTDWTGSLSFTYDPLGRMTSSIDANGQTFTYELDAAGRRKGLVYPDGTSLRLDYNEKGQLCEMTSRGFSTGYRYDAYGRISGKVMSIAGSGMKPGKTITENFAYAPSGKISRLTQMEGDGLLSDYAYRYDEIGNMIRKEETLYQEGNREELLYSYEYDPLNRLKNVSVTDPLGACVATEEYEYDRFGNCVRQIKNGIITENKYNIENQLVAQKSTGENPKEIVCFYDKSGRLTHTKGSWESLREYDSAGHLNRLSKGSGSLNMTVNSLGHILGEHYKDACAGHDTSRRFWIDYSQESLPVLGMAEGDSWTGFVRDYSLLGRFDGQKWNAFLCDEKGSVNQVLGDGCLPGGTGKRIRYDSFGNIEGEDGWTSNHPVFGYTGLYRSMTGDCWRTASREYDPGMGRFLSRDDDRYLKIARPETLNQYQYCFSNPVIWVDPAGTDCYIFYKADSADCSFSQQKQLAKQYGYDISRVHMIPFSDRQSFEEAWNAMGTENGQKVDIDTVVIESHSNPYVIGDNQHFQMSTTDIRRLQNKDMDNLILEGCNTGHMDHVGDNVASEFARKTNGAAVLAADGTVYYGKGIFPWSKSWYKPKGDQHFRDHRPEGSKRKADGWVVYRADENGNITTDKIGKKKMTVTKMLKELRKYPKLRARCAAGHGGGGGFR